MITILRVPYVVLFAYHCILSCYAQLLNVYTTIIYATVASECTSLATILKL